MKKETKEKLKAFLDKAVKFFTETETIYVEDKNGNYTAVRTEAFDKLDQEIKNFINDINSSLDGLEEGQKQEIKEAITMLKQMDFSKVDSSAISKILEEAQKEIEDSKSIHIDTPTQIGKGGFMGVVHRTEDGENLGNPTKPTGGFMLPRNEKLAEEFGGDYTKTDKSVEIFKKALEKINEIEKETDGKSNEELRKKVIDTLKKNKETVIDSAVNNSINKPKGTKIKQVHRNKGLKRIAAVVLAATIAASALAIGISMKSQDVLPITVSAVQTINMDMPQYVDGIIKDIAIDVGALDSQQSGATKEAAILNKTDDELKQMGLENLITDTPEEKASDNSSSYTERKNTIINDIYGNINEKTGETKKEGIITKYNKIKNPTNQQWLQYQEDIAEKNIELLVLQKEIVENTNKYAEAWIDFNEEHIENGISDAAEVRHENEIENSSIIIDTNNMKLDEINKQIEKFESSRKFLEDLKGLKQVEDIKDIRSFCRNYV